jgi:hypothetical protein
MCLEFALPVFNTPVNEQEFTSVQPDPGGLAESQGGEHLAGGSAFNDSVASGWGPDHFLLKRSEIFNHLDSSFREAIDLHAKLCRQSLE